MEQREQSSVGQVRLARRVGVESLCASLLPPHPGLQECLGAFVEETGMFGRAHADFAGAEQAAEWEHEGHLWRVGIAGDVETIRVRAASSP